MARADENPAGAANRPIRADAFRPCCGRMFFIEKVGSRIGAHRCRREKGRDAMKKFEWAVLLLAGLAIGAPAHGDDEFDALTSGYDQKVSEWYERLAEAQTEDGTYDAAKIPPHPAEEYVRAFEAYAKKHARTPKAVRALVWIAGVGAKNAPSGKGLAAGKAALGVLAEHHAADGVLGEVISELVFAWATALRDEWPTAARCILDGRAGALERLSRRVTDENRALKLRRLAVGYLAGRL